MFHSEALKTVILKFRKDAVFWVIYCIRSFTLKPLYSRCDLWKSRLVNDFDAPMDYMDK